MSGSNGTSIEIGHSDQELVGSKKKFNYKKAAWVSTIFLIVAAIIVTVIVLAVVGDDEADAGKPALSSVALEDILAFKFYAKKNNATWISDTELLYQNDDKNLVKYDTVSKVQTVLLGNDTLINEAFRYEISADRKFVLVERDPQKIFRHSTKSLYNVVELATKKSTEVTVTETPQDYLFLAQWAPVGNAIVLVKDNNIYYKPNVDAKPVQITTDGSPDIFNGICDWVYEEEVFASKTALWFSPDATKLAYIRFNDTEVHVMNLQLYGPPGYIEFQYPLSIPINYPKVGTKNPLVNLFSVDLSKLTAFTLDEMKVPSPLASVDHILASVAWQNNNSVGSLWTNRVQNHAYIQTCTGTNCVQLKEIVSNDGWLELALQFKKDGSQIALVTSQQQGADGGYRHLTLIPTSVGAADIALTKGKYVVSDIVYWDEATNVIFYSANNETDSQISNIYGVKAEAGTEPSCLTCNIVIDGVRQTYFSAKFSESGQKVVIVNEGPSIPKVNIYTWNVTANNSIVLDWISEWEQNTAIKEMLTNKLVPKIQYFDVRLDSGFDARVKLMLPPNADLSGDRKYPLLVDVYAGPNSYAGSDTWDISWGTYLVTNKSVIYAYINGRGSGLRGDKLMHAIYRKFGTVEVEDQIETAKKLSEKYNFIDKNHMAIWGWSYGGFSSAMALAKDNAGVFKCAASVAPVTDWTYYDSIYTERYMGLPTAEDNLGGYQRSRITSMADSFKNKTFYLIHGTLDDNVHYQQSMALARTLETHDVLFKQMSYPDEDHSLGGVRTHLYHSLGRFFGECFNLADL